LYYGPGGKAHVPKEPFTFLKEDMGGTSPKFDVIDANRILWKVKMGIEARPETVASRIVWAAGYFADEDYFLPELHVENMPRLSRAHVSPDGTVHNVRLKKVPDENTRFDNWSWATNPFTGTREWYGLRVLMALINNWDLKDDNNLIYEVRGEHPERRYLIGDLGATFGTTGLNWGAKGNLHAYERSKWILSVSADYVDFNVPSRPSIDRILAIPDVVRRLGLIWIGRHIPCPDARWMGNLLSQLSPEQIRDAFRAGGYSADDVEGFSRVVERRIHELEQL
jgi:hypothetical protein